MSGPVTAHDDDRIGRVRAVLWTNVVLTSAVAVVLVAAPGRVDRWLETGQVPMIRLVGLGLAAFAGTVAWIARSHDRRLLGGALVVAIADGTWVIASVITVLAGWFGRSGVAAVLGCALVVGLLAGVELAVWRGATGAGTARATPAPAQRVEERHVARRTGV